MKFLIVKDDKMSHPRVALCPQCKKRKVFEPHAMVMLSGGALLLDRKCKNSIDSDALSGFLQLTWHGAHDNGVGDNRDIYTMVDVAVDVTGGQFELYFCSTACIRAFFGSWVDALEKRIERERKTRPSPKRIKRELDEMRKHGLLEE